MAGVPKDITGRRYGRLVAVRRTDKKDRSSWIWECKCDCGETVFYSVSRLTQGVKSCGCLWEEEIRKKNKNKGPRLKALGREVKPTGGKKSDRGNESESKWPYTYICWHKTRRKWQVVTPDGYVGIYETIQEAENARNASLIGLPKEVSDWVWKSGKTISGIVSDAYEKEHKEEEV